MNRMSQRLEQLRGEYDKGTRRLEALDQERRDLCETMLRISGAIQVLEELIAQDGVVEEHLEQVS